MRKFILFGLLILLFSIGTASADIDASKFNSAVSSELGKVADMETLYQRVNQIYDVVEHDDMHIVWKFTGTTGDYAFVFADGRLAVASMAKLSLSSKDTLEKELNDIIDLIDVIVGVSEEEREKTVDNAAYYGSDAGIYHRIKYEFNQDFEFKLSVPDCTEKESRFTILGQEGPCPAKYGRCKSYYYIDEEQITGCTGPSYGTGGRYYACTIPSPIDITGKLYSGVHVLKADMTYGTHILYIESITSPAPKNFVLYSDDYKTWIEETTKSLKMDEFPKFVELVKPTPTPTTIQTTVPSATPTETTTTPAPLLTPAIVLSNSGGGNWKYYREITIKENSGKTLTDYQVLIELNSANFDFSKAKSDGSDIRFVDSDGNELSYWIEEWNDGKAKIWVKVPNIPANGQAKIKMYYGNPSAGKVSNGESVFELFEDFEDYVLGDLNGQGGWIAKAPFDVVNDRVKTGTKALRLGNEVNAEKTFSSLTGLAFRGYVWGNPARQTDIRIYEGTTPRFFVRLGSANNLVYSPDGRTIIDTGYDYTPNHWHKVEMRVEGPGKSLKVFLDDVEAATGIASNYGQLNKIVLTIEYFSGSEYGRWDQIFIRKYSAPEPTLALSEEHSVTVIPTKTEKPSETPGFEIVFAIIGLLFVYTYSRRKMQ